MNDLRQHTEQLREATRLLALLEKTDDTDLLRSAAIAAQQERIKAARRELTKTRVRT
jgi:hypothetical protein